MRLDIITIFPEYFAPLGVSLIGKAVRRGDITVAVHDLRSWTHDPHRTVDDTPFGGGPGMIMRPEPWGEAIDAVLGVGDGAGLAGDGAGLAGDRGAGGDGGAGTQLIVPSPAGELFVQRTAAELASCGRLIFACGRYEGIDARVTEYARTLMPVRELSVGDYVLAGGEPAVLVMAEAICRLLPGVLGNEQSVADDSFGAGAGPMHGLIEGPAYTRPRTWRGRDVPEVLLSGNHAAIARWRRDEALRRTARTRPDLAAELARGPISDRDRQVIADARFANMGDDVAD